MAKISVIVPVYQVEAYLDRCADSLRRQTEPDIEVIFVDDGSPDRCGQLCDGYAAEDGRFHVIHQENGGLSAARNAGIDWVFANSNSSWLAFVDSDDWLHPEFLSRLYQAVTETGCRIAACDFFRTQGQPLPEPGAPSVEVVSAQEFYCQESYEEFAVVSCSKLYHRSLFETLRFPGGRLHEDEFTTYRLLYQGKKVAVCREKLYAYYQNPQGIMLSRWNPRRMDILDALQEQIAFAREQGDQLLLQKVSEKYIYSASEHLKQADAQYHRQLRQRLRRALALGRETGSFPGTSRNLWAYELAYPAGPLWNWVDRLSQKK